MQINWNFIKKRYMIPIIIIFAAAVLIFIVLLTNHHSKPDKSEPIYNPQGEHISATTNASDKFFSEIEYNAQIARLTDDANLLSGDEAERLLYELNRISESLRFDFVIVTTNTLGGKTPGDYAEDFYDNNKFGYGERNDGILLLVSMEDRDWYICTTGRGVDIIPDDDLDKIADVFLPDLSAGNYYSAFISFVTSTEQIVQNKQ